MVKKYFLIFKNTSGQSALSITILVGGTVMILGVTLAVMIFSFINSGLTLKHSTQALHASLGGINDALIRVTRGEFPEGSCESNYNINLNGVSVLVQVGRYSPLSACSVGEIEPEDPGKVYLISRASFSGRNSLLFADVNIDVKSGALDIVSIRPAVLGSIACGGGVCD
jgi:hypothetical protein